MNTKAILFDLDGTLLSMDQDHFIKTYMGALASYIAPFGYDPEAFCKGLWKGTGAMIMNNGHKKNESVFWEVFASYFPDMDVQRDMAHFDEFYMTRFDSIKEKVSILEPMSLEVVKAAKEKGLRVILATNPLFPSIATEKRIAWAGLKVSDFEFFTSYENSSYSKPSLGYYEEVLSKAGLDATECLMVGNDVSDDMVAEKLGMKTFLLTPHLINKDNTDISSYPNGSYKDLIEFIRSL